MRKQKAISILKRQLKKLDTISEVDSSLWHQQTSTFIRSFFSTKSTEFEFIKHFSFTNTSDGVNETRAFKIAQLRGYLNNCIETIEYLGVYKPPTKNYLSSLPSWLLTIILFGVIGLSLIVGTYFFIVDNSNLQQQVEKLELKEFQKSNDRIVLDTIIIRSTPKP